MELSWYHVLRLPDGTTTPGIFDLAPYVRHYGIPERLDGLRVLEVGTWDGFWAFELERRGASVVALDLDDEAELDWPARRRPASFPGVRRGAAFARAHELYGSRVERVVRSIYHATPEELGTFDLVFCGSVLIHLRDQVLALERMAALCTDRLILAEEHDRRSRLVPWPSARYLADREAAVVFWLPNVRAWKRMVWGAGFDRVEEVSRFSMKATEGWSVPHVVLHGRKGR